MARLPHNVERVRDYTKGGFRFVAYAGTGHAFRCFKLVHMSGPATWHATPSHRNADADHRRFSADTLHALAAKVGASGPLGGK